MAWKTPEDRRSAGRHGNQHVCLRRPQVSGCDSFTFYVGGPPGVTRSRSRDRGHTGVHLRRFCNSPVFVILQETDHASRRRPGRRGRWRRSAVELRMSGLPGSANRASRAAKHPGLDRDQRRRRALVPDQRLARSAPAIDRDAAASPQRRKTSSQPDRGRDPDQWRNRCGRGPAVDARGLAVHDLRARQGAFDPADPTASSTC